MFPHTVIHGQAKGDPVEEALFIAHTCLGLQPNEDLLIACDYSHVDMARKFAESLSCPMMVIPPLAFNGEEPPSQVAHLFQSYDAVLALTTLSLGPTEARKKACERGVRFVSMAGITRESLQTVINTDYNIVEKRASKLAEMLQSADCIEVASGGRTVELFVHGRSPMPLTGIYAEKGAFGTLPEGEVLVAPVEEVGQGAFTVDVGMVGVGFFEHPVTFYVEGGQVTSIEPHNQVLEKILDSHEGSRQIAEVAVGLNPVAQYRTIFEAKKVEGSCHISLGDNHTIGGIHRCAIHMDGVISSPTITVDGETIVDHGTLAGWLQ